MAQIDIKNCTIRFCDGRLGTLTIGTSTSAVTYTALSQHWGSRTAIRVRHVNGGASQSLSVVVSGYDITVNLATDGASVVTSTANDVKAAVDGNVDAAALVTTVSGGAGLAAVAAYASLATGSRTLVIKVGEGNLTYSEKQSRQYILDRGELDDVRDGDDEPIDVSLDLVWEFITAETGSGTPTPEDVLKKVGEASGWATTSDDPCEPYCIDIELENDANCSSQEREFVMFEEFHWESLDQDLRAGTIKLTGKCNRTRASLYRIV